MHRLFERGGELSKPTVAITMGDPAGIGPEILLKAMLDPVADDTNCVAVGDCATLRKAAELLKIPVEICCISSPNGGKYRSGKLNLIDMKNVDISTLKPGVVCGMCGKAAFDYISKSVDLAMNRQVNSVATTPINKESLKAGGINFIGHTEIFGDLTNTHDPLTMFQVLGMRVFFLSRHVSLRRACDMVTKERIIDYVIRCKEALRQLSVTAGTMAVAGLNPHNGEHGLFGDEEVESIKPAVEELRKNGYDVTGPIPADSVFHLTRIGRFNSVLSLYHDQGHIAAKTLDFDRTIAVTLGMPILRTSVDHGTAFDIAWQGVANPLSLIEAIKVAAEYSLIFVKNTRLPF